jgi:SAM-dependent methyltransferase
VEGLNGYLTDVPYLRTYARHLAPPLLRLTAALNGFPPPPDADFDYGELGSGNGDTLVTLAAANPGSRFLGVDLNPEHVAFASRLARQGEVENARFLAADFEDLGASSLPSFHYLAAHGLLTWVSPAKRSALLAFASRRLAPGGLFYVSYDALPGFAALAPLRRLLVEATQGDGDTLDRARRGLALADLLASAGAAYFADNPAVQSMLGTMKKNGLAYVAHEYFQPHWQPMYVAEVAREMAAHDLHYVGQLPLHLNYRDLALPPALAQMLGGVADRLVFESLKDYGRNELFRRDVYIKGPVPRADEVTRAFLDATPLGTTLPASLVAREARFGDVTLHLEGPVFDALIPLLAERAATVPELAAHPALRAFGEPRVRAAALHLLLAEQLAPLGAPTLLPFPEGACSLPLAYNRRALAQEAAEGSQVVLASPALGAGLVLSAEEAAALRAFLAAGGQGDAAFRRERAPKLRQLGVLEPAGLGLEGRA